MDKSDILRAPRGVRIALQVRDLLESSNNNNLPFKEDHDHPWEIMLRLMSGRKWIEGIEEDNILLSGNWQVFVTFIW